MFLPNPSKPGKKKMLEYIRKHESINESDYAELNNCTRYRAGKRTETVFGRRYHP